MEHGFTAADVVWSPVLAAEMDGQDFCIRCRHQACMAAAIWEIQQHGVGSYGVATCHGRQRLAMGAPFRAGGLDGPSNGPMQGLLQALPDITGHAQSNGGRPGVERSDMPLLQYMCGEAFSFHPNLTGGSKRPRGGPLAKAKVNNTRKALHIPNSQRQPRPRQGHGMQGKADHVGYGERGLKATCDAPKLSSWTMTGAVNVDPMKWEGVKESNNRPREQETEGSGEGHGRAEGAPRADGRRKGSMEKAFEIASNSSDFRKAVEGLTKNFWAKSTTAVKRSRRQEVLKLAEMVMGRLPVFPLTKGGVEGVAAALKAAELASGDQYLNELKLMHVEAGHPIEAWLMRVLALCKKSLTRNRGPVKKSAGGDAGIYTMDGLEFKGRP